MVTALYRHPLSERIFSAHALHTVLRFPPVFERACLLPDEWQTVRRWLRHVYGARDAVKILSVAGWVGR